MPKHFIKTKENFKCDMCGFEVIGTGYTNHCPKCLWSKHVDEIIPGDRKSGCLGLMKPIGVDKKGETYILVHKCNQCGKVARNKLLENDNLEEVINISSKSI